MLKTRVNTRRGTNKWANTCGVHICGWPWICAQLTFDKLLSVFTVEKGVPEESPFFYVKSNAFLYDNYMKYTIETSFRMVTSFVFQWAKQYDLSKKCVDFKILIFYGINNSLPKWINEPILSLRRWNYYEYLKLFFEFLHSFITKDILWIHLHSQITNEKNTTCSLLISSQSRINCINAATQSLVVCLFLWLYLTAPSVQHCLLFFCVCPQTPEKSCENKIKEKKW